MALVPVALGRQHHRLAQSVPDRTKKSAQHVQPPLPPQLPQVHVETDLLSRLQPKDRQHIRRRPDPQIRALGISRPRQHLPSTRQRHDNTALGVFTRPATRNDQIDDSLPILDPSPCHPHIRKIPLQLRVEEALHVVPQQLRHQAMLTSPRTQTHPDFLDQTHRGPRPRADGEQRHARGAPAGPRRHRAGRLLAPHGPHRLRAVAGPGSPAPPPASARSGTSTARAASCSRTTPPWAVLLFAEVS